MVYLQHRVSPHSYSGDRSLRWDRRCRQSALHCLQPPLLQMRPVIMDLSPPDHPPHNTRPSPPTSCCCGPARSGGRPPRPVRVSSLHWHVVTVLSASWQPLDPGPERLLGWWWQARGRHTEPPSGPLDCSSCRSVCTLAVVTVEPTVPEAWHQTA